MEAKVESKTLPKELVERIIATMPFPYIFKARRLSKLWLPRLSPIASLDDETTKRLAVSFQKQLGERSKRWGTFHPVCIKQTHFIAFNRASHSWQTMPSLNFLPLTRVNSSQVQIIGALLLAPTWPIVDRVNSVWGAGESNLLQRKDLFVANILTGSWKQLSPRPQVPRRGSYAVDRRTDYGENLVSDTSSGTYRVISFCRQYDRYFVQFYHSQSAAWSTRMLNGVVEHFYYLRSPAYLNGVLHMMAGYRDDFPVSFDIEAGTWEKFRLSYSDVTNEVITMQYLLICNSDLMVVRSFVPTTQKVFQVLKVDLVSLQLSMVAGHPPAARTMSLGRCSIGPRAEFGQEPVSDGSSIFLGMDKSNRSMVEYDVHKNKWSSSKFPATNPSERYDWDASCLQPGLNRFIAV